MVAKNCRGEAKDASLCWAGALPDSLSPIVADGWAVIEILLAGEFQLAGQYCSVMEISRMRRVPAR